MNKDFKKLEAELMDFRSQYLKAPRAGFELAAKSRLLARLEETDKENQPFWSWLLKPQLAGALLLAVMVVLATAGVAASEQALPGDALYGLKRAKEAVLVASTLEPEDRVQLKLEITQRRAEELSALVEEGNETAISGVSDEFVSGVVESRDEIEQLPESQQGRLRQEAQVHFETGKELLEKAAEKAEDKSRKELEKALKALEDDQDKNPKDKDDGDKVKGKHSEQKEKQKNDHQDEDDKDDDEKD